MRCWAGDDDTIGFVWPNCWSNKSLYGLTLSAVSLFPHIREDASRILGPVVADDTTDQVESQVRQQDRKGDTLKLEGRGPENNRLPPILGARELSRSRLRRGRHDGVEDLDELGHLEE